MLYKEPHVWFGTSFRKSEVILHAQYENRNKNHRFLIEKKFLIIVQRLMCKNLQNQKQSHLGMVGNTLHIRASEVPYSAIWVRKAATWSTGSVEPS